MANLQKIKDIAERKKISIRELAERVGLKENQIHVMCRTNSTKIDTLEKIAIELGVSVACFFDDDVTITERYEQHGDHNLQAHQIDKLKITDNRGVPSCTLDNQQCSSAVLAERVKSLQALVDEKNERINELKERIEELKTK